MISRRRLQALCSQLAPAFCSEEEEEDAAFRRYCEEGKAKALALGNRGAIRLGPDGKLAKDILDAFWATGFYVFENVITGEELKTAQEEFEALRENAPAAKGSPTDRHGRPVRHPSIYHFVKPLGDPTGGNKGRPLKMREPTPAPGTPEQILGTIDHQLAHLDSALLVSGHPLLLKVAEAVEGPDFTPFMDNIFIKLPGQGASTAWHCDVLQNYDEDWKAGRLEKGQVGVNFHFSLYHCTPENGLWVLPGSSRAHGRQDLKALSAQAGGSDRLIGAVPVICGPGDVYIQDRMALHGAFANISSTLRVCFQFGFHRRSSVIGKSRPGYWRKADGTKNKRDVYDEDFVHERCRMIQLAIDARHQKYPNETPFEYLPFRGREEECRWSERLKEDFYGEYWMKDLMV